VISFYPTDRRKPENVKQIDRRWAE